MPHLIVSISGHGYGHVAQTAPVLNRLHRLMPRLRITVRSAVPSATSAVHACHAPFEHMESHGDIGMLMSSALDVRRRRTARAAYRTFHADWQARVDGEAGLLRELGADMVFSNVGYLPLTGAQRAGIPNAALCSLNCTTSTVITVVQTTSQRRYMNAMPMQMPSCARHQAWRWTICPTSYRFHPSPTSARTDATN